MKTREEIEQLANDSWEGCDGCDKHDEYLFIKGFIYGYRQLREEVYTKEDIRKAFYYGGKSAIDEYGTFEDYIKSLNKQDNDKRRNS